MSAPARYPLWPHGACECVQGCQCARAAGPAVYSLKRNGVPMKVCTRCDLGGDTDKELLVTEDDDGGVLQAYDALGCFVVLMTLGAQHGRAENAS